MSDSNQRSFDELLAPVDETCAGIRTLMLAEAERELGEDELRDIESHVGECNACQQVLSGEDVVGAGPMVLPSETEWARIEREIHAATGLSQAARAHWRQERSRSSDGVSDAPEESSLRSAPLTTPAAAREPSVWRMASLPAAALLLFAILLISQLGPSTDDVPGAGLDPFELAEFEPDVEILDAPDDVQTFVWTPDDGEGVMVFITSS